MWEIPETTRTVVGSDLYRMKRLLMFAGKDGTGGVCVWQK